MKYCQKCGKEHVDEATLCLQCGYLFQPTKEEQVQKEQAPKEQVQKCTTGTESKVLGICAIVFGALGGLVGLILSIIGLVTYKEDCNKTNCKIGLTLSIVGIVCQIILISTYLPTFSYLLA